MASSPTSDAAGITVLGIESSCDETAAAVVRGREILSNVVADQNDLHAPFRGVVPEIASRAHAERITSVVERAMTQAGARPETLDAIAVTYRPGLIGSLLVGLSAAKSIALAWDKPLVGVDHIEAHLHSTLMSGQIEPPAAVLVASGGHTSLYHLAGPGDARHLGSTMDDAVGEAFDKVASLLGLGFPGGPAVEDAAVDGNPAAFDFPRSMLHSGDHNFSFSGLKTAVLYALRDRGRGGPVPALPRCDLESRASSAVKAETNCLRWLHRRGDPVEPKLRSDLCASFQEAAVDVLVAKTIDAAKAVRAHSVAVGGGVACNGRLRERLAARAAREGFACHFPDRSLCGDNGAMIASLGALHFARGIRSGLDLDAFPRIETSRSPRQKKKARR